MPAALSIAKTRRPWTRKHTVHNAKSDHPWPPLNLNCKLVGVRTDEQFDALQRRQNDTDSVSLVLGVVGAVSQSELVHTARNEASSRQGIATHCEFHTSVLSESVQSFDDYLLTATFRVAPTEGVSQYCASPVFLQKSMSKGHSSIVR